jgi:hypothetical protein
VAPAVAWGVAADRTGPGGWLDPARGGFVLMVCTTTYRRRAMGLEEPGKGLGVDWEGNLIYNVQKPTVADLARCRATDPQERGATFLPLGGTPRL